MRAAQKYSDRNYEVVNAHYRNLCDPAKLVTAYCRLNYCGHVPLIWPRALSFFFLLLKSIHI